MLQHVMFLSALLLSLGCSQAYNHQHRFFPRSKMHTMHLLEDSQAHAPKEAQMMHAMQHAQHALTSSSDAATAVQADPAAPGTSCAVLREKWQCAESKDCLWCQNKHSPWPGSDGVCVDSDQAKYLPDTTYTCAPTAVQPEQAAAATAQLQGDSQSCSTVRDKEECSNQKDCLWCQNKRSPWPGSDGVCVDPSQAKYLPPSAYKCDRKPAEALPLRSSPTADKPKPDPSKACSVLHNKDTCATCKDCIWCQNKFSPWSGSDGVCIEPDHACELPKWTYKCEYKQPVALAAA